jgi:hypothetical protein
MAVGSRAPRARVAAAAGHLPDRTRAHVTEIIRQSIAPASSSAPPIPRPRAGATRRSGAVSLWRAIRGGAVLDWDAVLRLCTWEDEQAVAELAASPGITGTQWRDRRDQRARRRRHDDHRPPHPDRPMLTPPHDLLQPLPLLIGQPPRPHRLGHRSCSTPDPSHDRVWKQSPRPVSRPCAARILDCVADLYCHQLT